MTNRKEKKITKTRPDMSALVAHLVSKYRATPQEGGLVLIKHGVMIDTQKKRIVLPDSFNEVGHKNGLNLKNEETWSSLMLLLHLLDKGYSPKSIWMEKTYRLGVNNSGRVDFLLSDPDGKNSYMIDAKTGDEFDAAMEDKKKARQIFSYARQDGSVSLVSFYTYDFKKGEHKFGSVDLAEYKDSGTVEDAIKQFRASLGGYDSRNFILENEIFGRPPLKVIRHSDLKDLGDDNIADIKRRFLEALRVNVVSDKPGAFMVLVNLLLCKIYDETGGKDSEFKVTNDHGEVTTCSGTYFQYIEKAETDECFMKRLQDVFKTAAHEYLKQDILDYSDEDIDLYIEGDKAPGIKKIFDDLRLKRNNPFSFLEVCNDKTFKNNTKVVKEVVAILQGYRFRYNFRQQFLGNFFEELLVTSIKQDEGQFFTPVPLVDFIINSLPFENWFDNNAKKTPPVRNLPRVIDFAAGAGHFLISYMDRMQNILDSTDKNGDKKYGDVYSGAECYGWVKDTNVVGIEKDYRLAKTSKVASFFNGDGEMCMVTGDGVNKFSSDEYRGTCLHTDGSDNKNEIFDFVVSNPPFAVKGFNQNFMNLGIDKNDFSLLDSYEPTKKSGGIEIFFVERAWQLLKPQGIAVLLLPQSILTASKYQCLRDYIFGNFCIKAMLMTGDLTFFKTSTSPVTLFLQKKKMKKNDYSVLFMYSERCLDVKSKREEEQGFLGYEFSTNKNSPSIKTYQDESALNTKVLPILKKFLVGGRLDRDSLGKYCEIKPLDTVILGKERQIFPRYNAPKEGNPLSEYFECVSDVEKASKPSDEFPYLEISDMDNGKISHKNKKQNNNGKICRKGDILISTLTPRSDKICVADRGYTVSTAIGILRIKDKHKKNSAKLLEKLRSDCVLGQMIMLSEGFKVTYSKISFYSIMNYVRLSL